MKHFFLATSRRAALGRLAMLGLVAPAFAFTILFFLVPLAFLLAYSTFGYVQGRIVFSVTLDNYATLLGDPFYLQIIGRTVLIAIATTALCILLGYPAALGIVRAPPRWRAILLMLTLMPLLIGGVIRSYGWILILDEGGLINWILLTTSLADRPIKMLFNFFSVLVAMVEVLIPFLILPLVAALSQIDPAVHNASLSLGATRAQTFFRVTLPLTLSGAIAGSSIVFSLALNIFIVARVMGGPGYLLLGPLVYQQVGEVGNIPFGSAVAALMLVFTLVILILVNKALLTRYRYLRTA